jgi:N-acetylglucosamine-6-sulfatase
MRRTVLVMASAALAILFILAITGSPPTVAQTTPVKPNFVFILADDMREDDLKYMPKTRDLLGAQGMQFANAFVTNPLCCPSRATIMRGQYAHNTGVWTNTPGPDGAWEGYKNHGDEQDNIATRFHGAGYRTGLFGKYFNDYDGSTVPPGWDDWFGVPSGTGVFNYYVNDNGTQKFFGNSESDYATDVLSRETQSFIDASVVANKPFLAYVAPKPPHEPAVPAPRHQHAFDGEKAPRLPSFNESDVSDKPPSIQSLPVLSPTQIAEIDAHHEKRVESLQSVDDLVEAVVNKLQNVGALNTTYVVFTSDNGWHHGEHRIKSGKAKPYEESIRMPLLVRGPGVQAGTTTDKLTLNTDFFPTFTDLAGVTTPEYVDGRSLRPVLEGSATTWRTAILLEIRPSILGIRTSDGRKYIEYGDGFKEYYDLKADPNELRNLVYYGEVPPGDLATRLQALKGCVGDACRAAEGQSDTTTPPPSSTDTTAPRVTSTSPVANATGVAPSANVIATFSEKMMASSINTQTFKLLKVTSSGTTQITNVSVSLSTDGLTATLNPFGTSTTTHLARGTKYKAVVSTGAKDMASNQLDQDQTPSNGLQQKAWTFTIRN